MLSQASTSAVQLAFCLGQLQTCTAMSELWQRLRQARRYADLTQADLAAGCHVSRGAVALWEAAEPEHRTKPTTDHLIAISKKTGVPLEWLMNDASDLEGLWRLKGEFEASPPAGYVRADVRADVLPDLRQGGHLFVFAQTPEQIAAKVLQLAAEPPGTKTHLIVIGASADVHTVESPTAALAAVVQVLTAAH